MIVVTGGFGFIGSNVVKILNKAGYKDILVVDNLENGRKFSNLLGAKFKNFYHKDYFIDNLSSLHREYNFSRIIHLGACSSTMEWNGNYLMSNNFDYSKSLVNFCGGKNIPFIYASSASVYGRGGAGFEENNVSTEQLNMYAYSKYLFDEYIESEILPTSKSQIVGLRYFNVFGAGEQHKGRMASVIHHFNNNVINEGKCILFGGSHGYANGEQERDFVWVEDCANLNLWFLKHPDISGIYNAGSGRTHTFNDIAGYVVDWHVKNSAIKAEIEYKEFPKNLLGNYQSFTKASLDLLRSIGCDYKFTSTKSAVEGYLNILNQQHRYTK